MTAITQDEQRRMKVHVVRGGGGLRLHVREWGNADGPPILFIHGWSQNHLCWERQYESALRDEFRLVAFDLRGHGMSEAPAGPGPYTDGKLWADDLVVIAEQGGVRTQITDHVAFEVARAAKEDVLGLRVQPRDDGQERRALLSREACFGLQGLLVRRAAARRVGIEADGALASGHTRS